jgi:predicted deacylase
MVERECFTVAPFAGHYESLIDCGQRVRRGDVVGLLHDFDHIDAPPWPAAAGVEGVVIAQAWVAPVQRGQHIVVTGKVID